MEFEKSSVTIELSLRMGVMKMMLNENSVRIECRRSDEGDV